MACLAAEALAKARTRASHARPSSGGRRGGRCSHSWRRSCGSSSRCGSSCGRCWKRRSRRWSPQIGGSRTTPCGFEHLEIVAEHRPPARIAGALAGGPARVLGALHGRAGVLGDRQIAQARRHAGSAGRIAGDVRGLAAKLRHQALRRGPLTMSPTTAELIAALPKEIRRDRTAAGAASALVLRPTPLGRFRRLTAAGHAAGQDRRRLPVPLAARLVPQRRREQATPGRDALADRPGACWTR